MRTYLAGPMRHRPFFNFPAFDSAAEDLRSRGFHVISPADLDRAAGFDPKRLPANWDWGTLPDGFELRHAAKRDLEALLSCEAIHLLPGWEGSKGANAELAVAHWVGLKVFDYEDQQEIKKPPPETSQVPDDGRNVGPGRSEE